MKSMLWMQKTLFVMGFVFSILFTISSESFLGIWLGMEMNLVFVIPIFISMQESKSNKILSIYFIIQSISSVILLVSHFSIPVMENLSEFLYMAFIFSIFMKLGVFPFHFWVPMMMEGISWMSCFFLSVLQKIIPLFIISIQLPKKFIFVFIIMNSLVSTISGLNQYLLRKIMGFSSINHLSFILISIYLSKKIFYIYFVNYMFITFLTFWAFDSKKVNNLSQLYTLGLTTKSSMMKMIILMNSMAGVPPFAMFIPKVMTIMLMMEYSMFLVALTLVSLSLFATFFYLRMSYNSFFCFNYETKKLSLTSEKQTNMEMYIMFLLFVPFIFLI